MSKIYEPDCRGCAYNRADWFTREMDHCQHPNSVYTLATFTRRNECGLKGKWFVPKALNIVQRAAVRIFRIPVLVEKESVAAPYRVGSWAED